MCAAPAIASRNLYLQFVFAWLTGNGDLHGKNVAILGESANRTKNEENRDGDRRRWTIAPVYDIPCTLLYGDDTMALPVAGKTKGLRKRHWAELADSIGLPQRAAESANQLALNASASVALKDLPIVGSPLNRTMRELQLRRRELQI